MAKQAEPENNDLTKARERIRILEAQLETLESAREQQVEYLLARQAELMGDVADLLTRNIR